MKFNPFRPNSIVAPGMFCGRVEEMVSIQQSLLQAKHGNPKHFLIEGERGIGKSSLMYYIQLVSSGTIAGFRNTSYQFLPVPIELSVGMSCGDIIRRIASELRSQMMSRGEVSALAKSAFEFLSKWNIFGLEYKGQEEATALAEHIDDLARQMASIIDSTMGKLVRGKPLDGIVLLIDEADKPSENARLGEFVKLFTERLTKLGCDRVRLGLAGLPSLNPRLRASHESSPRVFETLSLQALTRDECKEVIKRGLEDGNSKNSQPTTISDDALDLIATLAEGYPHFIQQFSYSAFDKDKDFNISIDDVEEGAFNENGALEQLGKRYFHELYFDRISSDDYRRVLHAMTEHMDEWVSRQDIMKEAGVSASQVNNALTALKQRQVILANPAHKGEYRLPTKSFAVWLRGVETKRSVQSDLKDG